MNEIFGQMIDRCMQVLAALKEDVVVLHVSMRKKANKELMFRKLIGVYYGVSALIGALGYTPEDVQRGIKQYMRDNNIKA